MNWTGGTRRIKVHEAPSNTKKSSSKASMLSRSAWNMFDALKSRVINPLQQRRQQQRMSLHARDGDDDERSNAAAIDTWVENKRASVLASIKKNLDLSYLVPMDDDNEYSCDKDSEKNRNANKSIFLSKKVLHPLKKGNDLIEYETMSPSIIQPPQHRNVQIFDEKKDEKTNYPSPRDQTIQMKRRESPSVHSYLTFGEDVSLAANVSHIPPDGINRSPSPCFGSQNENWNDFFEKAKSIFHEIDTNHGQVEVDSHKENGRVQRVDDHNSELIPSKTTLKTERNPAIKLIQHVKEAGLAPEQASGAENLKPNVSPDIVDPDENSGWCDFLEGSYGKPIADQARFISQRKLQGQVNRLSRSIAKCEILFTETNAPEPQTGIENLIHQSHLRPLQGSVDHDCHSAVTHHNQLTHEYHEEPPQMESMESNSTPCPPLSLDTILNMFREEEKRTPCGDEKRMPREHLIDKNIAIFPFQSDSLILPSSEPLSSFILDHHGGDDNAPSKLPLNKSHSKDDGITETQIQKPPTKLGESISSPILRQTTPLTQYGERLFGPGKGMDIHPSPTFTEMPRDTCTMSLFIAKETSSPELECVSRPQSAFVQINSNRVQEIHEHDDPKVEGDVHGPIPSLKRAIEDLVDQSVQTFKKRLLEILEEQFA